MKQSKPNALLAHQSVQGDCGHAWRRPNPTAYFLVHLSRFAIETGRVHFSQGANPDSLEQKLKLSVVSVYV